jgi:eukaryotic-like serine/threonine-protein kinase
VIDHFVILDPSGGGGSAYLVMDFVEGEDLEHRLERNGSPLPEAQVVAWLNQVCDALEYLHNQQPPVIHRDIKPANIKVTPAGKAVLVDFGIAKLFDPNLRTSVGARAYTSGYSPPEQYGRGATDPQSDVYALGATAYHLLTGLLPPDSMDIVSGGADPLPPAHQVNAPVSPRVSAALARAVQLNRVDRWKSVAEFWVALRPSPPVPFPDGEKGVKTAVLVQPATLQARTLPLEAAVPAPAFQRRAWLGVGLGGLGLAGMVMLGLAIWGLSSLLGGGRHTPTPENSRAVLLKEINDPKGVPMALIPAGEFQMGSDNGSDNEKPVHKVSLNAFYMDVYEVTNARYAECVSAGTCQSPTQSKSYTRSSYYGDSQYADYPVIYVTWEMAKNYCEWRGGRLPSEAQWEKAARGGLQGMDYPWGDESPVCEKGAQNGAKFDDNAGCDSADTDPVGSYSPNGYGLFDTAGNIWEWVWDWYSESYYSSQASFTNPFGPESGDYHVVRGGTWSFNSNGLRVARREWNGLSYGNLPFGFRCSRSP